MPIYEFECTACGHRFDELMRLSDPEPALCPSCGAAQVRKRLSAPQFRLAGGGWYETDFKKDGDSKRNLAGDGGEAKPSEAKDSGAKPAEGKAAEGKSAEGKPAQSKPAESKPVDRASGDSKSSGKTTEPPAASKPVSTPPPSSTT